MRITRNQDGQKATYVLEGRLDTNTSPELEAELDLDGVTEVCFDFAALEYISSAGLRVLMTAQKKMMASGGKVVVANCNPTVKDVFDITGLSGIFTMV